MKILFSINATLRDTRALTVGRAVEALFSASDRLRPEVLLLGDTEIGAFDVTGGFGGVWAKSLPDQAFGLRWRRKRAVRYTAEIRHGFANAKGSPVEGHLVFDATWDAKVDWDDLFEQLCRILAAADSTFLVYDGQLRTTTNAFALDETRRLLVKGHAVCLPATRVDPTVVALAAAAGFRVIDIGAAWVFSVTDSLAQSLSDPEAFAVRQRTLEKILNRE